MDVDDPPAIASDDLGGHQLEIARRAPAARPRGRSSARQPFGGVGRIAERDAGRCRRRPRARSAGASARSLSTSTTRAGASGPSARSSASRLLPRPETATATCIGMAGEANRSGAAGVRLQDDVDRGREVGGRPENAPQRRRRARRVRPRPISSPRPLNRSAGKHVAEPVADPPAAGEIESVVGRRALVEQRARLPALAGAGEVGVVGTVIVRLQPGARRGQELVQPAARSRRRRPRPADRARCPIGWSPRWPGAPPGSAGRSLRRRRAGAAPRRGRRGSRCPR